MASAIPTPLLTPLLRQPPPRPPAAPYRRLVIALVLFNLVLFLSVLGLNYVASFRLDEDAAAINVAGRQRALLQRIPLLLLQLRELRQRGGELLPAQAELQGVVELFDDALNAFDAGGLVRGDIRPARIHALKPGRARDLLAQAQSIWQPYRQRIEPIWRQQTGVTEDLHNVAAAYARENNLVLVGLMGDLTTQMEESSRASTRRLRLWQALAGAGALLSFAGLVAVFVSKVRQSDRFLDEYADSLQSSNDQLQMTASVLATAKQEADLILTTVRQGMMLLDPSLRISRQFSEELRRLFHESDLAGRDFLELLQPRLNERMYRTTADYLELLFNSAKKEKQLAKINPLAQIELSFPGADGQPAASILEFSFRRIYDGERIIRLFVSVRDITPQVRLEQRARAEEARKERQIELLLNMLHLEPATLGEFLAHARRELERAEDAFHPLGRGAGGEEQRREDLRELLAAVHNIKGNAATLQLAPFERAAHEFEDDVRSVLGCSALDPEALVDLRLRLVEFRATLDEGRDLAGRLRAFARADSGGDPIVDSIGALVQATALKNGKSVRVDAAGFSSLLIPTEHRVLVHDILIQLGRNAVVHGIETPAARQAAGKPAEGLLRLSGRLDESVPGRQSYRLQVEDDGAGLDYRRVRERAIALGLTTPAAADSLSGDELNAFIFESGFTTARSETTHSGHGAGLNFVRRRVINDLGGGIAVANDPGRSLRFSIVLPVLTPVAHETAHRG